MDKTEIIHATVCACAECRHHKGYSFRMIEEPNVDILLAIPQKEPFQFDTPEFIEYQLERQVDKSDGSYQYKYREAFRGKL